MKIIVATLIILINTSIMTANPVETRSGKEILLLEMREDLRNIHSIKTILKRYVESQFPHREKHQKTRILKALVHKIKGKILKVIRRENLKMSWLAKEDMLARMLK
eukprot:GFUD01139399.1.p1 GENE.GFUD01139399.1~~GFUD01139399.1.p1  ORF type:complete len:106 (+),score=30.35 GFUD01139399.1:58-375(+)